MPRSLPATNRLVLMDAPLGRCPPALQKLHIWFGNSSSLPADPTANGGFPLKSYAPALVTPQYLPAVDHYVQFLSTVTPAITLTRPVTTTPKLRSEWTLGDLGS